MRDKRGSVNLPARNRPCARSARPAGEHTFVIEGSGPSPVDGHFLAGFLEAEGSFGLRPNNGGQSWQCAMSLNLRDDDVEILAELLHLTGLGRLNRVPAR